MNTTGFTYGGKHSSFFGIVCDPESRILLPAKRRESIVIPGKSGAYFQGSAYEPRTETFHCYFKLDKEQNLSTAAREIAYWLSKDGQLRFDNEPDKYYKAFFGGAIPLVRHLKYGEFDLSFTYNPPFAFGNMITVPIERGSNRIDYAGTAETPCLILLKNTSGEDITNITLTLKVRR